ncbi:MAG: carotenoid biosynthesis protein [Verrucomicrobia bacterium]|jgi:hypothetical protein|nr:carotenoid biosynthesis protein [Verrucomicrobiota bacterium]
MLFHPGFERPHSEGPTERWMYRSLSLLLGLLWVVVLARQFPALSWLDKADWAEPCLLVAALLFTVSSLARQIPLQNALLAACVIAVVGGAAHWSSAVAGIPFGPIRFPQAQGTTPFQEWFFVPAVLWVVLLLNARGVARLILEPRARHRNHGWHVIGLAAGLMLLMSLALEPFASVVHHYWLWGETRLPLTWQGAPLSALVGWGVVSVIGLMAATPALIDKHPRPARPSTDALWMWVLLSLLLAAGTAVAGLWIPAGAAAANALLALAMFGIARRR